MMTVRKKARAAGATVVLMGALAACGRSSTANDTLKRDLELAGSTSLELAPRSAGTQVVSPIEETPGAVRANSTTKVRSQSKAAAAPKVTRQAPKVAAAPEPARDEASTAAQAQSPSLPATPAPTPTPVPTPQRRGGYKSVGDIIRNAPFPINP